MTKLEKSQMDLLTVSTEVGKLIPEYFKEKISMSLSVRYNNHEKSLYFYVFISDDEIYNDGDSVWGYEYKNVDGFLEAIKNRKNEIIENRNKTKKARIKEMKKALKRMEVENDQ